MSPPRPNLHRQSGTVTRTERERRLGQRGSVVWLTGLSGAGKSTLAHALEARLHGMGRTVYVLDGDNVRHGLCSDLGFAAADRHENIRRIGHVAALFADAGVIVLTAFLSPFRADREAARDTIGADFFEVFVDAPLATCEQRDPKGLYRLAREGRIAEFTGISSPYEPPDSPDLHLRTDRSGVDELVDALCGFLASRGRLAPPPESPS